MSKAKGRELRAKGRRRRVALAFERARRVQADALLARAEAESRRLDEEIARREPDPRWVDAFSSARKALG